MPTPLSCRHEWNSHSCLYEQEAAGPRKRRVALRYMGDFLLTRGPIGDNMSFGDILPRDISSNPLSEPVLLILLSLAGQPRHGYSILKDVEEMSGGRVTLSTGTLYGALRRLLDDKWIERFEEDDAARDRHAYRLTAKGRQNLLAEVARIKQLTRLASLRVS